jgi:hypothetical protein
MLHARLILRQFAAATVLFASLSIGMIAAGTARAEPPMTLPEQLQIHDPAGVINAAERTKLQRAIDRLYNERGLSLWVVYVKTFDNRTAADWANQVITASEFTDRDVLLAVATDARRYYLSAPEGLGQDRVNSIAAKNVEPNLKKGEWAQAGIAAASGIDRALDGSNTLTYVAAGVGGTAAVVGGGAYLYSRRIRRTHRRPAVHPVDRGARRLVQGDPHRHRQRRADQHRRARAGRRRVRRAGDRSVPQGRRSGAEGDRRFVRAAPAP